MGPWGGALIPSQPRSCGRCSAQKQRAQCAISFFFAKKSRASLGMRICTWSRFVRASVDLLYFRCLKVFGRLRAEHRHPTSPKPGELCSMSPVMGVLVKSMHLIRPAPFK